MTYGDFKLLVAAAAQRAASSFVINGSCDLLAVAINFTRKQLERRRDFELAKDTADLTITLGSAALLSSAVKSGTVTPIDIKTILWAQVSTNGGTSWMPLECSNRAKHMLTVARRMDQVSSTHKYQLIRYADSVYLSPSDTTSYDNASSVLVRMDVVKWLDEYNDVADTDFLLEHCADYMLLETLRYLQYFLKEDIRVKVSDEQLAAAWQGVISWDSNLILTGEDMNLE